MYVTDHLLTWQIISYFEHIQMLIERISDGAFVMANKLDFCYTNWVALRIICKFKEPTKSEVNS